MAKRIDSPPAQHAEVVALQADSERLRAHARRIRRQARAASEPRSNSCKQSGAQHLADGSGRRRRLTVIPPGLARRCASRSWAHSATSTVAGYYNCVSCPHG